MESPPCNFPLWRRPDKDTVIRLKDRPVGIGQDKGAPCRCWPPRRLMGDAQSQSGVLLIPSREDHGDPAGMAQSAAKSAGDRLRGPGAPGRRAALPDAGQRHSSDPIGNAPDPSAWCGGLGPVGDIPPRQLQDHIILHTTYF
jgi:hypothetical protein